MAAKGARKRPFFIGEKGVMGKKGRKRGREKGVEKGVGKRGKRGQVHFQEKGVGKRGHGKRGQVHFPSRLLFAGTPTRPDASASLGQRFDLSAKRFVSIRPLLLRISAQRIEFSSREFFGKQRLVGIPSQLGGCAESGKRGQVGKKGEKGVRFIFSCWDAHAP